MVEVVAVVASVNCCVVLLPMRPGEASIVRVDDAKELVVSELVTAKVVPATDVLVVGCWKSATTSTFCETVNLVAVTALLVSGALYAGFWLTIIKTSLGSAM